MDRRTALQTIGAATGLALTGTTALARSTPAPGDVLWAFETEGDVRSSPTVVDGTAYVGSNDRTLYAVDAETGELEWEFGVAPEPEKTDKAEGIWSSPQVVDGTVYFGANDYRVYAVDADSGELEWQYFTTKHVMSSPTVVDGTVYVCGRDRGMYALDAGTGDVVWTSSIGISGASPAVVEGRVFAGSYTVDDDESGKVAAFDAATGETEWEVGGIDTCSSPTVVDVPGYEAGIVVIGTLDEYVYAFDAATGERAWRLELEGAQDFASPTAKDGTVYVTRWGDGGILAVDAETGDRKWRADTNSAGHQSPTVVGDTVFLANQNAELFSVDAEDGGINWSERIHDAPILNATQASSIVVDGVLYTGGEDDRLYAIETGVEGSSEDTRVRQGILNHHHGWAESGDQDLDVQAVGTPTPTSTGADETAGTTATTAREGYGSWFENVANYRGTVDARGRSEVTVAVGVGDRGRLFGPPAVLVDPGTTVVWEWTGEGNAHNVVAADGSFESEIVNGAGHTFSHTFETGGITRYFCLPHRSGGMKGAVAVGRVEDEIVERSAQASGSGSAPGTATSPSPGSGSGGPTSTGGGTDASGSTPGFGVVEAVAAAAGVGYLLRRSDEE